MRSAGGDGCGASGHKIRLGYEFVCCEAERRVDEQLFGEIVQCDVPLYHAPCSDAALQPVGKCEPPSFYCCTATNAFSNRLPGKACMRARLDVLYAVEEVCRGAQQPVKM